MWNLHQRRRQDETISNRPVNPSFSFPLASLRARPAILVFSR